MMHNKLHTCICLSLEISKKLPRSFFAYNSCPQAFSSREFFFVWEGGKGGKGGGTGALRFISSPLSLSLSLYFASNTILSSTFFFFSKKHSFYLLAFPPFFWCGLVRREKKSLRLFIYIYKYNFPPQQSFTKKKKK